MTINSQLSLHTRSNIVLVLFLDRLKTFNRISASCWVSEAFDWHTQQVSSYYLKIEYQNVAFRLF